MFSLSTAAVAVSQVHKVFSERWKWLSIQTAVAHAYRTFLEDRYAPDHMPAPTRGMWECGMELVAVA